MRTFVAYVAVAWILHAFRAANGLFPVQRLLELQEGPHKVSTELSLGRSLVDALPSQETAFHGSAGASSSNQEASFTTTTATPPNFHTASSVELHPSDSREVRYPIQLAPGNPVVIVGPSTSAIHLDNVFSELIKDPLNGYMKLPTRMEYVSAPWLSDIYHHMFASFQRAYSKPPTAYELELKIPDELLLEFLLGRQRFFTNRGSVYRLQIRPGQWGAATPCKLLVRFHYKLKWSHGKYVWSVLSFWTTADRGSRLVLLGIFHVARTTISDFLRFVGAETFHPMVDDTRSANIFLVPSNPA